MIIFVIEMVDGLLIFFVIEFVLIKFVIEKVIVVCKSEIDEVVVLKDYFYKNLVLCFEEVDDCLSKMFLLVFYMNSVVSSDELCEVYDVCLLLLFEYGIWVGQYEGFYNVYVFFKVFDEFVILSEEQQKVIENVVCDFILLGVVFFVE